MENRKEFLMHEVLTHRYVPFYLSLPVRKELAQELHDLGYFDYDTGKITDVTQEYFDQLYEKRKSDLVKEITRLKRNQESMTYDQMSERLGYAEDTYYLHYFLRKMDRLGAISYREGEKFDSDLKIRILDLSKA